jgi:hypothetical protein
MKDFWIKINSGQNKPVGTNGAQLAQSGRKTEFLGRNKACHYQILMRQAIDGRRVWRWMHLQQSHPRRFYPHNPG